MSECRVKYIPYSTHSFFKLPKEKLQLDKKKTKIKKSAQVYYVGENQKSKLYSPEFFQVQDTLYSHYIKEQRWAPAIFSLVRFRWSAI